MNDTAINWWKRKSERFHNFIVLHNENVTRPCKAAQEAWNAPRSL
jgi:hypothetical protein